MRIAFIDPEGVNKGLNVGLGILAACIKNTGHEVKVVDLNNSPNGSVQKLKEISGYDVIGISLKSFTLESALRIARLIGRKDIICGGAHISLDGVNLLKQNVEFEVGFVGEAEESLIEFLEAKQKNTPLDKIKGIIYRNKENPADVVMSSFRPLKEDIDSFSFPDYSVFDSLNNGITDYPLVTSRGCPYSCIYCCVGKISGKKMRFRSIQSVIQEIKNVKNMFPLESFSILDDNFTFDISRAKNFCRGLMDNKINLNWSCPNGLRADRIDEELVSLMNQSDCRYVSIGIESLDEEVFDNIKKGEKQEDIKKAVALFNKYGIKINGFFLIGLPGDCLSKTIQSIYKSRQIGLDTAHWNMFVPYPGTEAWEWVNKEARILGDWKKGFHFGPKLSTTFETDGFTNKEMLYAYKLANIKCRNYSAFFDKDAPLWFNCVNLLNTILRYDSRRVFSHIKYILTNLSGVKKYLK